jgi:ribonuclease D
MPPPPDIVTDPARLATLAGECANSEAIGLDTEFVRERTYRAELCLVQVSTPAVVVCVDPLALPALAPLAGPLSSQAGPVKVMHAARQDLEVLAPAVGFMPRVFDTQVAAAIAGLPAQVGYAELVWRRLGITLDKAHTRTDWARRPLSPEQVAYALDDVRHLLALREILVAEIARAGRLGWLEEEMAALADPASIAVDPECAWLRVKGLGALDDDRARLARALAAWRERRAMARNRPRGWILDDAVLREIVQRAPRDVATLAAIPDMPANFVKHCGEEIEALIADAGLPRDLPPPPRRERPDPVVTARVKHLAGIVNGAARELGIATELLATRRDLERLAGGAQDGPLLRGWRRSAIGERLLAAL